MCRCLENLAPLPAQVRWQLTIHGKMFSKWCWQGDLEDGNEGKKSLSFIMKDLWTHFVLACRLYFSLCFQDSTGSNGNKEKGKTTLTSSVPGKQYSFTRTHTHLFPYVLSFFQITHLNSWLYLERSGKQSRYVLFHSCHMLLSCTMIGLISFHS